MSQSDFGTINTANTDGLELAAMLEGFRDAQNTSHSGVSRPSYAQAGGVWISTAATEWVINLYDGSVDTPIGYYNSSTKVYRAANAAKNGANSDITRLDACGPEVDSISIGKTALVSITSGIENIALGTNALSSATTGLGNIAIGKNSLTSLTSGQCSVAVGAYSSYSLTSGGNNTSIGHASFKDASTATDVVGLGKDAGRGNSAPFRDTFIGAYSGKNSSGAGGNVLVGYNSGISSVTFSNNTFIGNSAGASLSSITNSSGLGYQATVTGSNQVQLGNSSTTTYVYGTVQNRSDERDKADVRPTVLGLSFINSLVPVDYKWDLREDYKVEGQYLEDVLRTGKKKRSRFHHGFLAQDIKTQIDSSGIDFGGYQDHKIGGGQDVLSLGYDEFIAPMVKAIQELSEKVSALEQEIANIKGE